MNCHFLHLIQTWDFQVWQGCWLIIGLGLFWLTLDSASLSQPFKLLILLLGLKGDNFLFLWCWFFGNIWENGSMIGHGGRFISDFKCYFFYWPLPGASNYWHQKLHRHVELQDWIIPAKQGQRKSLWDISVVPAKSTPMLKSVKMKW